ncbi:carboxypeptidase-like regulatory domain-containing protein [Planctellipticum variicoloris]|uniref:carboxypeptidase-like regulatory domain-containing protein n=1 Tax=Planctellipticum variicoloris TaxID=3064265 RepID=UPI003013C82F|nr:carboxypeptidase-like regulatory domain-containing protein [Planctomycetaceae bacterium SH412]
MRTSILHASIALTLGAAVLAAGCSGGGDGASKRAQVFKAKGKVTYMGNPLVGASVAFSPQGNQPAAVARSDDNGEFSLMTYRAGDGAAAGDYKVMVTVTDEATPGEPKEAHGTVAGVDYAAAYSHSGKGKRSSNILPAKYSDAQNTPLTAKVEPNGKNEFTFELK